MIKLLEGDCLMRMKEIPSGSIDMIFADLPYGITKNKWDIIIPFKPMWEQYERIVKTNGAIVLTASQPFTSALVMSNPKLFKYSMVYQKTTPSGYYNAKKMPLRAHEDVLIFYNKLPKYNPQKTFGHKRKSCSAKTKRKSEKRMVGLDKCYNEGVPSKIKDYDSTERYPLSVQVFSTDKQKSTLHRTQKPVALSDYFIKTFTEEGDMVLDNVAGSGTTGVSCEKLNRNCILIENDPKSIKIIKNRLNL